MCDNRNYIQWIRSKVGHDKIILVFAGGCIFNERGKFCFNGEVTQINGDSPAERLKLVRPLKWQS